LFTLQLQSNNQVGAVVGRFDIRTLFFKHFQAIIVVWVLASQRLAVADFASSEIDINAKLGIQDTERTDINRLSLEK